MGQGQMGAQLLVADDESDVREFIAKFFRRRKIEVVTVNDGDEAVKAVVEQRPQVVLLDIKMDKMDGIEALKRIRELDKQVKVVMVTGRDDEEAKQKTKALGAYDFVHKPLEIDELEKVVLKLLEKAR